MSMENRIDPKFDTFDVRTEWNEGEKSWAKELAVFIHNDIEEGNDFPLKSNTGEVGEEFYIVVCSPQFKAEPNSEVEPVDLEQAIVMDAYSEDQVETILKSKIDTLGEMSLDAFEAKMREMFNMSDWDN